ncbi:MAG: hypothetical protein M5U26_00930 [Planctomycetota bacterium]|nr:hypothetical protein [Planctomycetota bacterium]
MTKEIPLLDSVQHSGVGILALDPAGTSERPQLLASTLLLPPEVLRFRNVLTAEDRDALARQLRSEQFADREAAVAKLRADGKDGLWRYGAFLAEADVAALDAAQKQLYRDLILDRVYRFEPGRALEYAKQLVNLGVLPANYLAGERPYLYKQLWRALEEAGKLDRVTRVEYERAYREAHRTVSPQRVLQHNERLLPLVINDRADHHYESDCFDDAWHAGHYRGYWEEPNRKALWLAMDRAGLWRVTGESDAARALAFSKDQLDEPAPYLALKVLGRDTQGRLLWVGEVEGRRGIWAAE